MPITPSAAPEVTLAPSLGRGGNPPRPAASVGEQVRSRPSPLPPSCAGGGGPLSYD